MTSTEDGSPLPGISIAIKGTNRGTTTDADGNYAINVPIGSTLIFSFIGMQTREVLVTENNLQPVREGAKGIKGKSIKTKKYFTPIPKSLYQDSVPKNEIGLAILTDETPSYSSKTNIDAENIRSIRRIGNNYIIKSETDPVRRTGFGLQISSALSFEKINRLPSFQNTFAQGRPLNGNSTWIGADQQEIFSWGPQIKTLKFDGQPYSYDKNGQLTAIGSGNGQLSKNYDAFKFFKTGLSNVNELLLTVPGPKSSTFIFDFENRHRTGVIPNSDYKKTNVGVNLHGLQLSDHLRANASLSYNQSSGNLLSRGANLSMIVGSVYRTPITFDNANGLTSNTALNAQETYRLNDNSLRSHAPGVADNPYGLANELPDHEKSQRLLGSLNLHYSPTGPFTFVFNSNIDRQLSDAFFGTPTSYSGSPDGRLTDRAEQQTFINAILTPSYQLNFYDGELKLGLSYQTQYTDRNLQRTDGFNFANDSFGVISDANSITHIGKTLKRTTQEIIANIHYEHYNWLNAKFAARNYFSNTVNYDRFVNFFPSGSLSVNLADLLYLWPVDYLKVYGTAARTIREAPLVYSNWSYASTNIELENYPSFYEATELIFHDDLAPETETKLETGVKLHTMNSQLTFEVAYFNNLTRDFIAPRATPAGFELSNLATVRNYGATISAGYSGYMANGNWGTELRWSKYNTVVRELNSADEWIALSGFESVQTILAEGKPLGAIYGSSFLRNSEGKKVIGTDGFPVEEQSLKMIGNPIPDWTLGWSAYMRWKRLNFSFLFDYRRGGDVWNGTNSVLDYLGRSSRTGSERNIANYIFDGVDYEGQPNVVPVSFSDPAQPLSENRWVRYGWDGVAEDYIEDATAFRLSELVCSYSIKNSVHSKVKEIRFSLIGRNLFLITPYSGVDPAATLFGYSTGNGLDLFNAPSTRSYGAQITLKI